ncbi:uncharacterized protein LOC120849922 [Ixodes scapularis]|uniref:uncharacterized protein LOC120849922 n=1 Tax=Ixodes scapularis TaxID=6945 RepID=UPI001A9ED646|nr:uncharacterized protein LOC120849922 [Ixodes scapularis]
MCDASEPFYFLAETPFRQQVSLCLREAPKCSYSPLRRAERAAELSKADLPQRWNPENRAMALAENPPAAGLLKGPSARRTCCGPCVMPSAPVQLPGVCVSRPRYQLGSSPWRGRHPVHHQLHHLGPSARGVALQADERRALRP